MDQIISTEHLPEQERFAYWREHVSKRHIRFDPEPVDRDIPFNAEIQGAVLGGMVFGYSRLVGIRGVRNSTHIATDLLDHYVLGISAVSSLVEQDGLREYVGPEHIVLFDGGKPLSYEHGHSQRGVTVAIPRHYLAGRLAEDSVQGVRITSATRGVGCLLNSFCRDIPKVMEEHPSTALRESLAEQFASLVALAFRPSSDGVERARPSMRQLQFRAAREFIEINIHDAHLSPKTVAAAIRISRSYLFRLFAENEISFQRYVRQRRLANVLADLMNPQLASLSISEIAFRNGFNNASHFSRIFTANYGESPRAYRARWLNP